jgi:hypothetical protein
MTSSLTRNLLDAAKITRSLRPFAANSTRFQTASRLQ